jgi:ABC-2 type transport system ATP-binding protein
MGDQAVVDVRDLHKRYGPVHAVRGVSFAIPEGTIFGLLGPNGAGKTSIIEMIEGIRRPDAGTIRVAGLDPVTQGRQVKHIIGAQLQTTALHDKIRIREILRLFASFYRTPKSEDEILDVVGLRHKASALYEDLSGGEKQRIALGLALIGNPQVVFLDEPTAGLDAEIRRELHKLILQIRDEGKVVLMSTHYIEEAEKLCDIVGMLQHGQLKAVAPPAELIRTRRNEERIQVAFSRAADLDRLGRLTGVSRVSFENGRFLLSGPDAGRMAASLTVYSEQEANQIREMKIFQATLEDVYLQVMSCGESA